MGRGGRANRHRNTGQKHGATNDMADMLDDLAEFEEFKQDILKCIRKDMRSGLSGEEILKKYSAMAAGRVLTIALTEEDTGKALTALKDVQDRAVGKAVDRQKITHDFEEMEDRDLDAMIMSKLKKQRAKDGADAEDDPVEH